MTTGNAFYPKKAEMSIYQQTSNGKDKPVTQEEKEAFQNELDNARGKIVFPQNPSLFPVSIRI